MWGRWDFHPQHGAVVNHCPPRVTLPVSVLMLLESCITAYSNLFITEINSCSLSIKTSFEKIVRLPLTPWLYHLRFSFVQERKHRGSFFSIPSANLTFVLRGTRFLFLSQEQVGRPKLLSSSSENSTPCGSRTRPCTASKAVASASVG